MKSTEIKNWSYELSYKEIAELDDFLEILTNAIGHDNCILCGGFRVLNDGLCLDCGRNLTGKDRTVSNYILDCVEVNVKVVLPDIYKDMVTKLMGNKRVDKVS